MSASSPTSQRHRVQWPSVAWGFRRPHRILAFGFGSGLIRPGSGTWGSVLALMLWWPLTALVPWGWLGAFLLVSAIAGVWICGKTTEDLDVPDHVGVVWDEIVAVWIVLWALPNVLWLLLLGFLLFRVFDIFKPWPIRQLDAQVGGGLGVMLDDGVAALYAIAGVWGCWWLYQTMAGQ